MPTRDSTRLSAYVFRPRVDGQVVDRSLPAVWAHDRYHQICPRGERQDFLEAVNARLGGEAVDDLGICDVEPDTVSLRSFPWAERLLSAGYVVVVVDTRGSGTSYGQSDGPFAETDATDAYDVTEWIAAQAWCDGKVGMFGRSYLGIAQYLAMSAAPPHLVAVFPQMALFDLYGFAYDGGVFRHDFARVWGDDVAANDLNGPAAPLDDDPSGAQLATARAQHRANRDVFEMFQALPHRDSGLEPTGEQPYLTRSPSALLAAVNASGVAVYHLGGWHDVWARDALLWARNLTVPHRLVIGPWPHTGGLMGGHGYNLADEHVRWFDYWLKGVDTGVMDEPAIRYYAMGAPDVAGWRAADSWPPPGVEIGRWHLHRVGCLSADAPDDSAVGVYQIDYGTTTGKTSRWASGYGAPFDYPDLAANDARALCFTSAPLAESLEIAGSPVLTLTLSCDAPDVDVFAYLEAVDADGVSHYVTEGCLRASHRGQAPAPYADEGLPYHPGVSSGLQDLPAGPVELLLDLHPVSYVFAAGTSLRVAITGADQDNALTPVRHPAPVLTLFCGSHLALPVVTGVQQTAPLSVAQQAIWLAEQIGSAGPAYHLPAALEFQGEVDLDALWRAIDEIVRRHEVLRTTVADADGTPVQQIHPPVPLPRTTLQLAPALTAVDEWWQRPEVREFIDRHWDLGVEQPIRAAVVELADDRSGLLVVVHHIAGDQDAAAVFFRELAALYVAFVAGMPTPLAPLPVQYAQVAREQRAEQASAEMAAHLDYWRDRLEGAPALLDLPLDAVRPAALDHRGASVSFAFDRTLSIAVRELARTHHTSVFCVLVAAFDIMLAAYSGQSDVVVAVPSLQRDDPQRRDLIGCLVNVLPIRCRVDADLSVAAFLGEVRSALLEGLEHRTAPFDTLVSRLAAGRDPAVQPLTQVSIRLGRQAPVELDLGGVRAAVRPAAARAVKFDLAAAVDEVDDRLVGTFDYRTALFTGKSVERMVECFTTVVTEMVANPDASLGTLPKMSRGNLRTVLERWNPSLPSPVGQMLRSAGVTAEEKGDIRCYVLDGSGKPVPPGARGELFVGGRAVDRAAALVPSAQGFLPNPFTGQAAASLFRTGMAARFTADGTALRLDADDSGPRPAASASGTPDDTDDASSAGNGELFRQLNAIWCELLGVENVGPEDDFFDLGGDSLFAIRLISRIRKATGVRMALKDVFVASKLVQQTRWIDAQLAVTR